MAGINTLRISAMSISSRTLNLLQITCLLSNIMQWKLTSFSALLALASAAQSFLLETPTQPVVTGEEIVLFYTANATDPIASILLVNHALPNETFVVVWDAPTWSGTVAGIPPCVPTNMYVLGAASRYNDPLMHALQ